MLMKMALIVSLTASGLLTQDPPDIKALERGQPKDVALFISRAFGCRHFSGEEPYDKARSQEIKRAMEKLRCDRLAEDEERLRRKYKNRSSVLKALDATRSF